MSLSADVPDRGPRARPENAPARGAGFCTTHWSAVLAAGGADSTAQAALAELCQSYWYPLYAFIRRRGHSPDEAEDLTQAFFERFLEKNCLQELIPGMGRFRSFLLASVKHFLANEWDRARTWKRGGGKSFISLDGLAAEERYQIDPPDPRTPESLYDQQWACTLLERILAQLRQEFSAGERASLFDELKGFLSASQATGSYREIAARTGLKEGTLKVAVYRLRRRYGELLRQEIARTVRDPQEVEEEIRHLIAVLAR